MVHRCLNITFSKSVLKKKKKVSRQFTIFRYILFFLSCVAHLRFQCIGTHTTTACKTAAARWSASKSVSQPIIRRIVIIIAYNNNNNNDDDDGDEMMTMMMMMMMIIIITIIIIITVLKGVIPGLYDLLAAPRTVSNSFAQVAQARSCENHVPHIQH